MSRSRTWPKWARVLAPLAITVVLFLLFPSIARFATELPGRFVAGTAAERATDPLQALTTVFEGAAISLVPFLAWSVGLGLALCWLLLELGLRRSIGSNWSRRRFTRRR